MKTFFTVSIVMFCTCFSSGQNQITPPEASVSAMMHFVGAPVSAYTGIPDISVPLFTVPTRSKNLTLNVAMGYHPSGVRLFEKEGENGRGWSLFGGGVISRQVVNKPDEQERISGTTVNDDVYMFSFPGHSGRFYLEEISGGALQLKVLENTGDNLSITFDYNTTTHKVNSFVIFDDKGYKYIFDVKDDETKKFVLGGTNVYYNYSSAYHLTQVMDNNNKELLRYNYYTYTNNPPVGATVGSLSSAYRKKKEILIPGYGKLLFNYSDESPTAAIDQVLLTFITLTDNFGQFVRKAYVRPTVIDFYDTPTHKVETYQFEYKTIAPGNNYTGMDRFGYPNLVPCLGLPHADLTSPNFCTNGVLYKMKLPTGGTIVYEWESNTYSRTSLAMPNPDAKLYKDNKDNFNDLSFSDRTFVPADSGTLTFTVTTPQTYVFYGTSESYTYRGVIRQPTFSISGPGGNQVLPLNTCSGLELTLEAGAYTIYIESQNNSLYGKGSVSIKNRQPIPDSNLWIYGGGLRIKNIKQFTYNIYDLADYGGYTPVSQTNYSYDFFNNSKLSSGVCLIDLSDYTAEQLASLPIQDFVGYKNVRITQTGNNGWSDFVYSTPADFPAYTAASAPQRVFFDYRRGKLMQKKVYRQDGVLLHEEVMDYLRMSSTTYEAGQGDPNMNAYLGWTRLISKISREYTSGSVNPMETSNSYTYDNTTRNILSYSMTNTLGETIKKELVYHTGNSIYSQNRISDVSQIRSYRGAELLTTEKINYNNVWAAINEGATASTSNVSWLPQSTEITKADRVSIVSSRVTSYDQYGRATEVQQENGTKTVYIYGYFMTKVVAKIDNPPATGISAALVTAVKNASDGTDESVLLTALANLRAALPDAMVTTYTYKPLIGISTVTDSKGDMIKYKYDAYGRQIYVLNGRNQMINNTNYNIRTNNPN